jgi:hypothetical protein
MTSAIIPPPLIWISREMTSMMYGPFASETLAPPIELSSQGGSGPYLISNQPIFGGLEIQADHVRH